MRVEPGERVVFGGHPSPLAAAPRYLRRLLLAGVGGVVAGLASAVAGSGRVQTSWVALTVVVLVGVTVLRGELRRRRVRYTITDRRLAVHSGIVARRRHEAWLEDVLDVSVTRSASERMLGLGTVVFTVATGPSPVLRFGGIDDPRRVAQLADAALDAAGAPLREPRQARVRAGRPAWGRPRARI